MNLGKLIKEKRIRKGLKQNELGAMLDVSGTYIGKLEKGMNSPSYAFLLKLCETLEIDIIEGFFLSLTHRKLPQALLDQLYALFNEYLYWTENPAVRSVFYRITSLPEDKQNSILKVMDVILDLADGGKTFEVKGKPVK